MAGLTSKFHFEKQLVDSSREALKVYLKEKRFYHTSVKDYVRVFDKCFNNRNIVEHGVMTPQQIKMHVDLYAKDKGITILKEYDK